MIQRPSHARFAPQSFERGRMTGQLIGQKLQRHHPAERRVDHTHGPRPASARIRYKIHLVAADARTAITFALSSGAHDAPEGRVLPEALGPMPEGLPLLMDRA